MKTRISFTAEEDINEILERLVKKRRFRNKSHVIEEAIRLIDREKNEK
jgi:Arc/MetJ-type ribon-helix-helix transcriptional regulator